jgi:hypothetical protein
MEEIILNLKQWGHLHYNSSLKKLQIRTVIILKTIFNLKEIVKLLVYNKDINPAKERVYQMPVNQQGT